MEVFKKYNYRFRDSSWLDKIHNIHDLYVYISDHNWDDLYLNYYTASRNYTKNPTTDREDKYLGLDGFLKDYNTNTKEFIYPESVITRYLSNISDIESMIKYLYNNRYYNDYSNYPYYLASLIASKRYFIGSKVFVELFRDSGKEQFVSKELMKELSPVIDMYKHLNLARFLNYNDRFSAANKHLEEVIKLIEKYPYLKEYYDKEIEEVKNNYKAIFLRICYYVYVIKKRKKSLVDYGLPKDFKKEALNHRNIIRGERIIPDNVLIDIENEVVAKFLTIIKYGRFRSKTFYKIIGPYQDR